MRRTLMINFDEAHARQLDELSRHFRLSAYDTMRLAIRLTHARMNKPDVLVPAFKPHASKNDWPDDNNQPS